MPHCNSTLLQSATALLLVFGLLGGRADAKYVRGKKDDSSTRDLIGLNQLINLVPVPDPTMPPTTLTTSSPSKAPESSNVIQGRQEDVPTKFPTHPPTPFPTHPPSLSPSISFLPTTSPTMVPSFEPSMSNATTDFPTFDFNVTEETSFPTDSPTDEPTQATTTSEPSEQPSTSQTQSPTEATTSYPTGSPISTPSPTEATSFTDVVDGAETEEDVPAAVKIGTEGPKTISGTICDPIQSEQFGTLCAVLEQSNLFLLLDDPSIQFTLFAPTNDAFGMSEEDLEDLIEDKAALEEVLSLHVVTTQLSYESLGCNTNTVTLNFEAILTLCVGDIKFTSADGNDIHNLPVVSSEVVATNGVILPVDNILLPAGYSFKRESKQEVVAEPELVDSAGVEVVDVDTTEVVTSDIETAEIPADEEELETDPEEEVEAIPEEKVDAVPEEEVEAVPEEEEVIDQMEQSFVIEMDDGGDDMNTTIVADEFDDTIEVDDLTDDMNFTSVDDMNSTSSLSTAMQMMMDNTPVTTSVGCLICEKEGCATSRDAVMMVPGEGEVLCSSVARKQKRGRAIIMGSSMCKVLQERYRQSCYVEGGSTEKKEKKPKSQKSRR